MSEHAEGTSRCVLPENVLKIVARLSRPCDRISQYELNTLTLFVEAAVLYDQVVTYPTHPARGVLIEQGLRMLPGVGGLLERANPWLLVADPYPELPLGERIAHAVSAVRTYRLSDGGRFADSHCLHTTYPPVDVPVDVQGVVQESLAALQVQPDYWSGIHEGDRDQYARDYATGQLSSLEALKRVRLNVGAEGAFLLPHWEPFWQLERKQYMSELQARVRNAEAALVRKHLGGFSSLDTSPLTIIALSSAPEPEMLVDTVCLMRRDYEELRLTSRQHASLLAKAETYADVSETVRRWTAAWDRTIAKLESHPVPLLRRLFSWDVVKRDRLRDVVIGIGENAVREWKDRALTAGLHTIGDIEQEFLFSSPVEANIKRLYGIPHLTAR